MLITKVRVAGAISSAVTAIWSCVVSPKLMPCGRKLKVPLPMAQSARVPAMGDGSGVSTTVVGWVRGVTLTRRTLVKAPVPVFSTWKVTAPVSQLSRTGRCRRRSPPPVNAVWMARFGPGAGTTVAQALIRPKQDEFEAHRVHGVEVGAAVLQARVLEGEAGRRPHLHLAELHPLGPSVRKTS